MTKEKAKEFIAKSVKSDVDIVKVADAINTLEQEQTTKNDLGVDCISRADALNCLKATELKKFDWIIDAREKISNLPSVTPQEPKRGHWIMTSDYLTTAYGSIDYVKCSCCGEDSLEEGNYCSNCGADMRISEEIL